MKRIETKSTVLLKHHLKALRLPTMTAECEKVAGNASPRTWTTSGSCCSCASWS